MTYLRTIGLASLLALSVAQSSNAAELIKKTGYSNTLAGSFTLINHRNVQVTVKNMVVSFYADPQCQGAPTHVVPVDGYAMSRAKSSMDYVLNGWAIYNDGPANVDQMKCVTLILLNPDMPDQGNPASFSVNCKDSYCLGTDAHDFTYNAKA